MNKKNYASHQKGFTLIELIIAMSLLGIVSSVAFSFIIFSAKVVDESGKEAEIQASTRITLYETTKIIRYSTAVFTIPRSSFRPDNLDRGWDYIGIQKVVITPAQNGNPAEYGYEIVKYTYDKTTNTHNQTILLSAQKGISFSFLFDKENPDNFDSLLKFTIEGYPSGSVDEYGHPRPTLSVTSETEAQNSLQVIDLASDNDPAYAIAFRSEERQKSVVGHVTMVLDKSGSMANDMRGYSVGYGSNSSRISILKTEANKMIDAFAQEDNIDIALVPFATSANTPNNNPVQFYNAKTNTPNLHTLVNAMNAVGGTNTGDGLRRAYWAFKTHNAEVPSGINVKNYVIILVDGVTTFASVISNSDRSFFMADGNVREGYLDRTDPRDSTGQIAGNGSTLDAKGTAYVNAVGGLLHSGNFAKAYVIGFTALSSELESVNDIADACGAAGDCVFRAASQDDLSLVFTTIQRDIVNDLWYLQGPKL
ncbi:MAG: VWA domain-containing protein [Clostridia bacterium]|nr:VWA domain-containing protein [Clostridia bacterium]